MNTRKFLVAVSALIAIFSIITVQAQAGFMDSVAQLASSSSFGKVPAGDQPTLSANMNSFIASNSPVGGVQKKPSVLVRKYTVQVSAYTSEVAQTDATPFITANGTYVHDGVVAANMFRFGTLLKIPSLYGDKIFVVEDRMNKRYQNNVDIWFADKAAALKLGRRTVTIEVIK